MKRALVAFSLAALCLMIGTPVRSQEPDGALLTLGVISDIHVQDWDQRSQAKFRGALADLQYVSPNANALIVVGDLTNGQPADYLKLRSILAERERPPVYFAIGNHEYYKAWYDSGGKYRPDLFPNGESEAAAQARFLGLTGTDRIYYDRWVGGYHLIVLGSEQYRQSGAGIGEDASLSKEQLAWLEGALKERHEAGRPIFVFLHQPVGDVVQGAELDRILRRYPEVILFSGHTHWELTAPGAFVRDGYTRVNTSSVVRPWGSHDQPLGPGRSEGLVVKVFPDRVEVLGREFARRAWISRATYTIPTTRNLKNGVSWHVDSGRKVR